MPYMKAAYDVGYLLPLVYLRSLAYLRTSTVGKICVDSREVTLVMIMFKINVLNYLTNKI